jgi:glycosyltransferase involved in cell wall biosynthesis
VNKLAATNSRGFSPELCVIVPTYSHPVLLSEALHSALSQKTDFEFAVVVCSDGCPLAETDRILTAFTLADPRVIYLRKRNGGPSSARNFAIDFALQTFPSMRAVYFLDADNRLADTALQIGYRALCRDPALGWAYPTIDSFGINWTANYAIPYSPLLHVIHENFCDTGSFVSRKVLESGVRFDESALNGYEDWDFWLQALSRGFRGKHVPFGFYYRQRPESRFREMNRSRAAMTELLRKRHATIASPKNLMRWEHEQNPRYMLISTEGGAHVKFSDPSDLSSKIDAQIFEADLWTSLKAGDEAWTPVVYIFGSPAVVAEIERFGLGPNTLLLLEREARQSGFAALTLRRDEGVIEFTRRSDVASGETTHEAQIWAVSGRSVRDLLEAKEPPQWLLAHTAPEGVAALCLRAPLRLPNAGGAFEAMCAQLDAWRLSEFREGANQRWIWRPAVLPRRDEYYDLMCKYFDVVRMTPRVSRDTIDVGFLVPIASFGGAEKVGYALAQVLRRGGEARTHLFVLGAAKMSIVSEYADAFDTINFLADPDVPVWGGPTLSFGQPIFLPGAPELHTERVVGMLLGLDLVVNCQSAPANSLMGALRKFKIKTISYLHLIDFSKHNRPVGHVHITVGFEHAYDLIVTCSRRLASELHLLGVPGEKIMAIPNAASFTISDARRDDARRRRRKARGDRALRCLYIGRLDHQKGVERLYRAVRQLIETGPPLEFRVVGSSLVDESGENWAEKFADLGLNIEPPVFTSERLAELYAWADVLLLPSRWEGAPLVIPECQQLGCIPICADVGAVDELIADGEDGLLVRGSGPDDAIADEVAAHVRNLAADDELRVELAAAAIARVEKTQWERNFEPLTSWITRNVTASKSIRGLPTRREGGPIRAEVEPGQQDDRTAISLLAELSA